ncbi:MAG: hypothetical protein ACLFWL_18765 [Candidatus Brocadiia bacterium]
MEDFGIPDHIHYADQNAGGLLDLVDHTLDHHNDIAGTVKERRSELAAEVEAMWQEVIDLLKSRLSCRNERNS